MVVHVIDVGQGAATLIEFPCGAILVDTGGEKAADFNGADALIVYLEAFFARRTDLNRTLDALFITHPHEDHALGALLVWNRTTVKNVITNGLQSGSGSAAQLVLEQKAAAAGVPVLQVMAAAIPAGGLTDAVIDSVSCRDVDPRISVLWGQATQDETRWGDATYKNPNNHSVVVRVEYGAASVLITGDLESPGITQLLARHDGTDALDVDLYEPGHHGSSNGTTQTFLDATTPEIAVLSAGDSTRKGARSAYGYGHPSKQVVVLLEVAMAGSRPSKDVQVGLGKQRFESYVLTKAVYATPWDGTVRVTMDASGAATVEVER